MTKFQNKVTINKFNDWTDILRDLSMNLIVNQRYRL